MIHVHDPRRTPGSADPVAIERIRLAATVLDELDAEVLDDSPLGHTDVADIGWTADQLRRAADWREENAAHTEAATLARVLHQALHECSRADCEYDHITPEQHALLDRTLDILRGAGWRHHPAAAYGPETAR